MNRDLRKEITEIIILSLYEDETDGVQRTAQEIIDFKKRAFDRYRGLSHDYPSGIVFNIFYARVNTTVALILKAIKENQIAYETYCHNKECKFHKIKFNPECIITDSESPNKRAVHRHLWDNGIYLCDHCSKVVTMATGLKPLPPSIIFRWEGCLVDNKRKTFGYQTK